MFLEPAPSWPAPSVRSKSTLLLLRPKPRGSLSSSFLYPLHLRASAVSSAFKACVSSSLHHPCSWASGPSDLGSQRQGPASKPLQAADHEQQGLCVAGPPAPLPAWPLVPGPLMGMPPALGPSLWQGLPMPPAPSILALLSCHPGLPPSYPAPPPAPGTLS